MPYSPDSPAHLTPEQRRREIAAILAKGVLRLRSCAKTAPVSGEPQERQAPARPPAGTQDPFLVSRLGTRRPGLFERLAAVPRRSGCV